MPVEATGSATTSSTPANIAGQEANPKSGDPSKATNILPAGAPFQITTHHERLRWLKILFYGRHGAGKTELAASAVDVDSMNDVLLIDAESGDSVVEESPRIKNSQRLYHIRVTSFAQVAKIQEFLTAYCKARDANDVARMRILYCKVSGADPETLTDEQVPRFKTVILDSLSEIEVYCQYSILNIATDKIIVDDIDTAGWPEFRKNNEMVKLLIRVFRDLPMHVIFVCAESYVQDEVKKMHYSPQLTGKLSAQVQGFVDICGRIVVGQATPESPEAPRRVYVQPVSGGASFDAKNRRSGFKGAYFENPSMKSIMKDIGMK